MRLGIFVGFLWMILGQLAQAEPTVWLKGADSSGGGKSVVCRDSNAHLISVELLDLYEAKAMFGLSPVSMGSSLDEVLDQAKSKLMHTIELPDPNIFQVMGRVKKNLRVMPAGTKLEPVDDASPVVLPQGCALEQTAVYVDEGLVVVDREHWEAMDARNKGALIVHEAIYYRSRGEGETNSRRARKIVGHLFSDFNFIYVKEDLPKDAITCISKKDDGKNMSMFFVYPNEKGETTFQFQELRGRFLFSKTTASTPNLKWPLGSNLAPGWGGSAELDSNFEVGEGIFVARAWTGNQSDGIKGLQMMEKDGPYPITCFDNDSK